MTPLDILFLLIAWVTTMLFISLVTYRRYRSHVLYNPMDEVFSHFYFVILLLILVIAGVTFNKWWLVAFGAGMFVLLVIYWILDYYISMKKQEEQDMVDTVPKATHMLKLRL